MIERCCPTLGKGEVRRGDAGDRYYQVGRCQCQRQETFSSSGQERHD